MEELVINKNKREFVSYKDKTYGCYAIHTPVVTHDDSLEDIVLTFASPLIQPRDVLFISEKMAACTEGRAIPVSDINTGFFASFLSKFVTKSSRGIGLSMPETMQCAIDEVGLARILLAAFCGAVGKIFGRKGWFYLVAGQKAASIDGPCSYTLPPYNKYVVLSPLNPDECARKASIVIGGNTVLIIDANDYGVNILGASESKVDFTMYENLLQQNPLGQSTQCTPMGILRPVK